MALCFVGGNHVGLLPTSDVSLRRVGGGVLHILQCSGCLHLVLLLLYAEVSEEHAASVFSVEGNGFELTLK